jgi:epoxyqueuosine reductase
MIYFTKEERWTTSIEKKMKPHELADYIMKTINYEVSNIHSVTKYREPLVRWVQADDPRFDELHTLVHPDLFLPNDMLHGAKSVITFFLPFDISIPKANAKDREKVAAEWAQAYIETNRLLKHITDTLTHNLAKRSILACADPPTHNFDPATMRSTWSHKSAAVIAGLGSFGLHQMVITDAGCAGRFSSLVIDAELPELDPDTKERCLHYANGTCEVCVKLCPTGALHTHKPLNKQLCWQCCLHNGENFKYLGVADICGKCATGPCAIRNPVKD